MISIGWGHLAFMLIPLLVVGYFLYKWKLGVGELAYATFRMVAQLIAIGYVLVYLFNNDSPFLMMIVLSIMIMASGWITLRHVGESGYKVLWQIILSISLAGLLMLALVILVIGIEPWYQSRYVIPLAGMIFASSMNSLSIFAERWHRELKDSEMIVARNQAFKASLIPKINSFFAVGLVSLPGMMTGQILSGVSPLIAVRYQIVVMAMILGVAGMSVVIYTHFTCKKDKNCLD